MSLRKYEDYEHDVAKAQRLINEVRQRDREEAAKRAAAGINTKVDYMTATLPINPPADWRRNLIYLCYTIDAPATLLADMCGVTLAFIRKYLRETHDVELDTAIRDARLGNFTSRVDYPRSRDIRAPAISLAGLRMLQDQEQAKSSGDEGFSEFVREVTAERRKIEGSLRELDIKEATLREQSRTLVNNNPGILGLNAGVEIDERE